MKNRKFYINYKNQYNEAIHRLIHKPRLLHYKNSYTRNNLNKQLQMYGTYRQLLNNSRKSWELRDHKLALDYDKQFNKYDQIIKKNAQLKNHLAQRFFRLLQNNENTNTENNKLKSQIQENRLHYQRQLVHNKQAQKDLQINIDNQYKKVIRNTKQQAAQKYQKALLKYHRKNTYSKSKLSRHLRHYKQKFNSLLQSNHDVKARNHKLTDIYNKQLEEYDERDIHLRHKLAHQKQNYSEAYDKLLQFNEELGTKNNELKDQNKKNKLNYQHQINYEKQNEKKLQSYINNQYHQKYNALLKSNESTKNENNKLKIQINEKKSLIQQQQISQEKQSQIINNHNELFKHQRKLLLLKNHKLSLYYTKQLNKINRKNAYLNDKLAHNAQKYNELLNSNKNSEVMNDELRNQNKQSQITFEINLKKVHQAVKVFQHRLERKHRNKILKYQDVIHKLVKELNNKDINPPENPNDSLDSGNNPSDSNQSSTNPYLKDKYNKVDPSQIQQNEDIERSQDFYEKRQRSYQAFEWLLKYAKEHHDNLIFECMAQVYLNQAYHLINFSNVWLLRDIPDNIYPDSKRKHLDIELLAKNSKTGALTGVQAEFHSNDHQINEDDIRNFSLEISNPIYTSGILMSSNDNWNPSTKDSIKNLNTRKPVILITRYKLKHAEIDWSKFDIHNLKKTMASNLRLKFHKKLKYYQRHAVNHAIQYYNDNSRGKLIMAPGSGKTYTSLNIAEKLQATQHKSEFYVLYLVPTIQLLSQTLFSWASDVNKDTNLINFAVTSDKDVTKKDSTKYDIGSIDIGFPATTNYKSFLYNYKQSRNSINDSNTKRMYVVFSTYQSIKVIHEAQKHGYPDFDLMISDEAHRTATKHQGRNSFVKIHDQHYIHSKKRLYQTATPKNFNNHDKEKTSENNHKIYSMNNKEIFGKTFYELNFGQAVKSHILTDYRIQIMLIDKDYIDNKMNNLINDKKGINDRDIGKIISIWNTMNGSCSNNKPLKRAIAFAYVNDNRNVTKQNRERVGSKQITHFFTPVINEYIKQKNLDNYHVSVHHADGAMNALQKEHSIDWLTEDIHKNHSHVLSNVQFLGEGIDVPSLDAIIFLAPMTSKIRIIQAVGRVMRKALNKSVGHVVIPMVVPFSQNLRFTLSQTSSRHNFLNILRALEQVDPRMERTINRLGPNNKDDRIQIINGNNVSDNFHDGKWRAMKEIFYEYIRSHI